MFDDVVIRAEGLGKKYVIGHQIQHERYVALRDIITRQVQRFARSSLDFARGHSPPLSSITEEFWALRGVNFEVKRGEVVGIIGRNGAGKSTLLKVLSRITEPSEGRVVIKGRVASLLEVGTGFHPELTGRENIFLNGAVLGMTRAEIRRKFHQIVTFAEIERFLDTPVKRYSSGMYVRLAFAVAAHLEPEIIVVDEVLAVGDAEFQKKCLGKMSEIAGAGRTILFVSHNMAAIQTLCPRSIYLDSGLVIASGRTSDIVSRYLEKRRCTRSEQFEPICIHEGLTLHALNCTPQIVQTGDNLELDVIFRARRAGRVRECAVIIYSITGSRVAILDARESDAIPFRYNEGKFALKAKINHLPLVEGDYSVSVYLVTDSFTGDLLELAEFSVGAPPPRDFVPYRAEHRGFVVLNSASSIFTWPDLVVQ
jgi:lipopolysaccharide transport system ATP-binding protein